MEDITARAEEYIKVLFKGECSGHDYHHSVRVCNTAEKLAAAEGADVVTVKLAALLHDADDRKLFPENKGFENAVGFMEKCGLDRDIIDRVCGIISQVSFKGDDSAVPDTIEGKCVQDADRLDALGAIGIARAFAYGGSKGRAMYDPHIPPREHLSAEEYRTLGSTTINHFYEKLLKLKDMMNTPHARKIAKKREAFMRGYLEEFFAEWNGER